MITTDIKQIVPAAPGWLAVYVTPDRDNYCVYPIVVWALKTDSDSPEESYVVAMIADEDGLVEEVAMLGDFLMLSSPNTSNEQVKQALKDYWNRRDKP